MPEIKKIMLPTDLSEVSEKVCSYALLLAKKYEAKIDIVYIIQEPSNLIDLLSFDTMAKKYADVASEKLNIFCSNHLKGKADYEIHIRKGIPFKEINKAAKELGSDMIVMGTQRKTGIDHALLGSTAERIVRLSSIPVLTVR